MKSKIFYATVLMWLCLGVIVIMCYFPPWIGIPKNNEFEDMTTWGGYHFITEPPISNFSPYHLGTKDYKYRIHFGRLGIQCVPALGIAALMYYIKVNDKRSRIIDKANTLKFGIIAKANTMKYGIIATVLVVLGAPVWLEVFGLWRMPMSLQTLTGVYFIFIGPPSAFITSILGLIYDKHKYLAVLTMLLIIAWIIFMCWVWFFVLPQFD